MLCIEANASVASFIDYVDINHLYKVKKLYLVTNNSHKIFLEETLTEPLNHGSWFLYSRIMIRIIWGWL